jgi:hypothetical protein
MSIEIDSTRTGRKYDVRRFTEFDIDLDLDTDADIFDLVVKNPDGIYTGIFSKFDDCKLKVNNGTILVGNLDKVEYIWTGSDDYIKLSGRDLCWKLVDNDALPDTLENIVPKTYISNKCREYGIKSSCASDSDIYDKLVIGCGESEISVMNNILLESKHRIWYSIDTVYTGEWYTGINASHTFVRGINNIPNVIPIKRLTLSEDGADMISELRIYGSNDDGTQKMVGKSTNPFMIARKILKRKTRRSYSDKASSKYTSVALKDMRDNFRDNIILTIAVRMDGKNIYLPNTTARVIDAITGIDSVFFIKKVQYSKTLDGGSTVSLMMIPADSTFERIWASSTTNSVTRLNKLSKEVR